MNSASDTRSWRRRAGLRPVRAAALFLALSAMAGCSGASPFGTRQAATATPVAATAPTDPVAAFAARATPGSSERIALPDGGAPAQVRLVRAYNAASGRECREVLIGTGMQERTRLLCREGNGWVEARPLLRPGGAARP